MNGRRPRLLDLFCGQGGASMGYHLAGFDVVGVDAVAQPLYPFEFHEADANTYPLEGFDAVHASPPCKEHTELAKTVRQQYDSGWMLAHTIERLQAWNAGPWVVENVEAADMPGALTLCGSEFRLEDDQYALKRHRRFVSNVFLMGAGGCLGHGRRSKRIIGVYGDLSNADRQTGRGPDGRTRASVARARQLMRMPWADAAGLAQAIPPDYTRFIGEQIMAAASVGQP